MMFDMELSIEVLELLIIELSAIVDDDDPREVESRDDGLSNEFSGLGLSDLGHRLWFHPFSEVINSYEQKFPLCWGRRKGSEDVDSSLSERPWCRYSRQPGG